MIFSDYSATPELTVRERTERAAHCSKTSLSDSRPGDVIIIIKHWQSQFPPVGQFLLTQELQNFNLVFLKYRNNNNKDIQMFLRSKKCRCIKKIMQT